MKRLLIVSDDGLTLTELMIVLSITIIVSTTAVFGYQRLLDNARETVCVTNVKALNKAVHTYAIENDAVPVVLADLKLDLLEKAYAQTMNDSDRYTRFCHLFLKINMSAEAYAAFLTYENLKHYGASQRMLQCPCDHDGGSSYGTNANLAGTLWAEVGNNVIVLADCDSQTFTREAQLKKRHGSGKVSIATTKGGNVVHFGDDAAASDTGGVTFDVDEDAASCGDLVHTVLGLGLPTNVENSYMANIEEVNTFINNGQTTAAINQLEAFIGKVEQDITHGDISQADGNNVIGMANYIISGLNT
jgi:Tfp pilus assembly protein FimT